MQQLTLEQQEKISQIKKEWLAELDNLPANVSKATFDSSEDIARLRLEKKYKKRIQDVLNTTSQ